MCILQRKDQAAGALEVGNEPTAANLSNICNGLCQGERDKPPLPRLLACSELHVLLQTCYTLICMFTGTVSHTLPPDPVPFLHGLPGAGNAGRILLATPYQVELYS